MKKNEYRVTIDCMGKKKFKFIFTAPFITIFAFLSIALFLLDVFAFKGNAVSGIFSCPGAKGSAVFSFTNPLHYIRLFLHVLGNTGALTLLSNMTILLILGPGMEEKFGKGIFMLMTLLSALVSGVLNACFGSSPAAGSESIVFLLIFLWQTESFIKKEIEIPRMLIFIPYTGAVIYLAYKNGCTVSSAVVYALESIAGGICGGILRFLISHEKKAEKTQGERASKQKGSLKSEITKIDPGQAKKRRPGRIKKAQIDDDVPTETEIGTL